VSAVLQRAGKLSKGREKWLEVHAAREAWMSLRTGRGKQGTGPRNRVSHSTVKDTMLTLLELPLEKTRCHGSSMPQVGKWQRPRRRLLRKATAGEVSGRLVCRLMWWEDSWPCRARIQGPCQLLPQSLSHCTRSPALIGTDGTSHGGQDTAPTHLQPYRRTAHSL